MEFKIANEDKKEEVSVEGKVDNKRSVKSDDAFKKRMRLIAIIVFGGFLVLMFILGIASLFGNRKYSYDNIEIILKDSAIDYFNDHKKRLPSTSTQVVEITDKTLVADQYMKDLSEYTKDNVVCSGKVTVQKVDGDYSYTPYLDCGDSYTTVSLYNAVTKKTVTVGDGLYKTSKGYSFRGEDVHNYIQLDHSLFRIVKIDESGVFFLISDEKYMEKSLWDDRYNIRYDDNYGINDYAASRMRIFLKDIYQLNEDYSLLSKKDKKNLTSVDLCVGSRNDNSSSKDNSEECSKVLNNQRIGLLTASDYMMASIDSNCTSTISESCQNYNYLSSDNNNWWLLTTKSSDPIYGYTVRTNISSEKLNKPLDIRPVVYLSDKVIIRGGKGTLEKPYKLK